jgi:ElaB/YqjD/DUF883 family membrane-anchored ribosome-binding protein
MARRHSASAVESPDTSETPAGDEPDALRMAADAVRCAEETLHEARAGYDRLRRQAAEQIAAVRKQTLGDVIDTTLSAVRKHPGAGILLSLLAGFFLGRLFKR